ncbi:MAG: hypothetical protein KKA60_09695 [Proteobacteria bacterium]|nr:hypothetical protein [Pseudomonadota bacterium]
MKPAPPVPENAPVRYRALFLGLFLALALCALTPVNNTYRQATLLGGGHFPLAPFFVLLWLTLGAGLFRSLSGRVLFTGRELLVVFTLMILVSGIAYTGLARTFFINLTAPFRFATAGNHWQEILGPLLPASWYPRDLEAVRLLYDGLPGGHSMGWMEVARGIPWAAWARPLLVWSGFVLLCYFVMICMVNLFAPQWIENERMDFPLMAVPQLMEQAVDSGGLMGFFANRYFLTGLCITVALHLVNGLSFYYPSVPAIPTLILAGPYFPKYGLFSGFYKLKIYIYPAFIGFAFLVSRRISLSFWVFFLGGALFIGVLAVLGYAVPAAALGITFGPVLSRPEETQMIGAYFVFFLFLVWLARRHLADAVMTAFSRRAAPRTDSQWISTRFSFWGFVLGSAGVCLWLAHFGLGFLPALLLTAAFFILYLVATRIICQGGVAYFTLTAAPTDALFGLFGTRWISGAGVLAAAVVQKVLFVDLRESLMPSVLHATKLTEGRGGKSRILFFAALTLVLAIGVSLVAMLTLAHRYGVRELSMDWATGTTVAVYENVRVLAESPQGASHWVIVFSLMGAGVMLLLVAGYHRFTWWPVHPLGYLMAYSSAMRILWFSFFCGWAANSLCMRYGGVALFKKLRNFFIGLVVGDFLMGGAFALAGLFTSASYQVLPN